MICKGDRLCIDSHIYVVCAGVNRKENFMIVFVYDDLPFAEDSYTTTLSFQEWGKLKRQRDKSLLTKALKPYCKNKK